jgi:hypothetical protein
MQMRFIAVSVFLLHAACAAVAVEHHSVGFMLGGGRAWPQFSETDRNHTDGGGGGYLGLSAETLMIPTVAFGLHAYRWFYAGDHLDALMAATSIYPSRGRSLVRIGFGYARSKWEFTNERLGDKSRPRDEGAGLMLGLGYEWRPSPGIAVTPELNASAGFQGGSLRSSLLLAFGVRYSWLLGPGA